MRRVSVFCRANTWIWALSGSALMWLAIGLASGNLNLASLSANAFSASFLAIAALGQMLVITTGRGAIDLSVPGTITLAAYLNMTVINGREHMVLAGTLLILASGALVGLLNGLCVVYLRIPPMIATLAMNYILSTFALLFNSAMGLERLNLPEALLYFARGKVLGIHFTVLFSAAVALLLFFLLRHTTYGHSLIALGQNHQAAHFAGIPCRRLEIGTYMAAGTLVALAGLLCSVRVGGAFLGMGDSYMLETVGGVVIGGTLISGGRASPVGTLLGCLFLTLVVTAMQVAGFSLGAQNVIKGALIILVLAAGMQSPARGEK